MTDKEKLEAIKNHLEYITNHDLFISDDDDLDTQEEKLSWTDGVTGAYQLGELDGLINACQYLLEKFFQETKNETH